MLKFFKTNVIKTFNSLWFKQKVDKIDAETGPSDEKNIILSLEKDALYYHKLLIIIRNVVIPVDILFVLFFIYCTIKPINYDFAVEEFIEPCNSTNVTATFDELKMMKKRLDEFSFAKNSIKFIAGYNISANTNEYLTDKYANLSTNYDELSHLFNEQKELYFNCYKENLLEKSKKNRGFFIFIKGILDATFCYGMLVLLKKIIRNKKLDELDALIKELSKEFIQQCESWEKLTTTHSNHLNADFISEYIKTRSDKLAKLRLSHTEVLNLSDKTKTIYGITIWTHNGCALFNFALYFFVSPFISKDLIQKFLS